MGRRVLVSVRLVRIADETTLWSHRFDLEVSDLFDLQDEIAGAVAYQRALNLDPGYGGDRPAPAPTCRHGTLGYHCLVAPRTRRALAARGVTLSQCHSHQQRSRSKMGSGGDLVSTSSSCALESVEASLEASAGRAASRPSSSLTAIAARAADSTVGSRPPGRAKLAFQPEGRNSIPGARSSPRRWHR